MKMHMIFFGLLFLSALVLSGCLSSARLEVLGPRTQEEKISPLEESPLEARIGRLEKMLSADGLDQNDRQVIERFIGSYSDLRQLSRIAVPNSDNARLISEVYGQIAFIEEQFFTNKRRGMGVPPGLDQYHQTNLAIFQSFLSRDYDGVIRHCQTLEESYGPQALTPETGLILALSLAEKDLIGEAIKIGTKVMKQLAGHPDLWLLRSKLVEWYLSEGQKDKALNIYGKLSDDLDERNKLFHKTENQLNRPLPKDDHETVGNKSAQIPAGTPLPAILEEADQLARKQAYTEAKLLLIKARIQTDNETDIRVIDQAMKDIDIRQKRIEQGEVLPTDDSSAKETLEMAAALIEEEKYEEALNALEKIEMQPQIPGNDAERLKERAIEKIINRERNRAAQLYLQAKQVHDPDKKKALLQSSLGVLKAVADKYPSSYLIERINEHISIVEKALRDL